MISLNLCLHNLFYVLFYPQSNKERGTFCYIPDCSPTRNHAERGQTALIIYIVLFLLTFLYLSVMGFSESATWIAKSFSSSYQMFRKLLSEFLRACFFRTISSLVQLRLRIGNYLDTSKGKPSCLNYLKVDYLAII